MDATNFRSYTKNTLRAFFDLQLPSGMILRGCTLHISHGKHWVGMPARSYENTAGATTWTPVVDFRDKATQDRFQREAVAVVLAVAREAEAAA